MEELYYLALLQQVRKVLVAESFGIAAAG